MLPKAADDMGLAAFAPAEGSKAIQTPYGSLQLANGALQQSFGPSATGLGGTLVPEESEEEEEDDDDEEDENGNRKRKRNVKAGAAKKAGTSASAPSARPPAPANAAGDRDLHTGRRKIRIEFIEDDSRRHITFSKRKAGIMKKAYELATLTGTQVLLLIVSQTGLVYTFTTPKLSPVVQQPAGRELIQSCLNAPEPGEQEDDLSALTAGMRSNAQEQHQQQQHQQQQQHLEPSVTAGSNGSNNGAGGMNAAHLSGGGNGNHQSNPSVYGAASAFHDPRQQAALLSMSSMAGMGMGIPAHMHGMGAYGYAGLQQMVGHDNAIPYGAYGGM